jgi:ubiquinone/menaquinone biosynthesis C-methylase UbiE
VVGSAVGWLLYRKASTYRYIPETIRLHPGGAALARLIESAGFERVAYRPVFGGFMALHEGKRPTTGGGHVVESRAARAESRR